MAKAAALFVACMALLASALPAGAAGKPPPADLPSGFEVPADFREDPARRQYWEFDAAQIDSQHKPEGRLWHVAVAALQPNNNADVIVALFATDLEKTGWTILRRQGALVAHRAGAGPELWVNGTGNSGDFRLVLIEVAPPPRSLALVAPAAEVESVPDDRDLPYFPPLPGSKAEKPAHDSRSIEIKLPNAPQSSLAFSQLTRWYDEPAGVSSYEFVTVYGTALAAAGWDVTRVQAGGDAAITAHYGKNGRDIWIYSHADGSKQSVNVVDYGAESKQSALEQQLAKDGHVALYGIYFDTDSAVPRPESEATLENVLEMLKSEPALKLEIQGHTDDTGTPDHNATLSDARAASVVAWLTGHGIAAANLTSKGYGATMPVADNKSPEGRAKNRRVELVSLSGAGATAAAAAGSPPPATTTAAQGPLQALPKGTVLGCTLGAVDGTDHRFVVRNTTAKPLKKETIVNTVLNWKSPQFPAGSKDDCFAIDSDLAPNASIDHTDALDPGEVGLTCQAYISAAHPVAVHDASGGTMAVCDPAGL